MRNKNRIEFEANSKRIQEEFKKKLQEVENKRPDIIGSASVSVSHAAIDSAVVCTGAIRNDADDTQQEPLKHKLPIQQPITNDISMSTPLNFVHSLPGYSKWFQGGRPSDRNWFRPCARQYSTILITDSQGASFARQNHKIPDVMIYAYSGLSLIFLSN